MTDYPQHVEHGERGSLAAGKRPKPTIMAKTPYGAQTPQEVLDIEAPAVQPVMQAVDVDVLSSIGGQEIVRDLCDRIAAQLSRHDALRASDCYRSYGAEVEIRLQLRDVDRTEIAAQVKVGSIDAAQPSTHVQLCAQGEGDTQPDASLEMPIDPAGISELPPRPRSYVTRGSSGQFVRGGK